MPQGAALAEVTNPPRAHTSSREIIKVFFMTISNRCKAASTLRRPFRDIGHFGYFSKCDYYSSKSHARATSRFREPPRGAHGGRAPASTSVLFARRVHTRPDVFFGLDLHKYAYSL